jgi:hypothetical protein
MVQVSPQVTAAQVLDAGRRAEAEGRFEYAIQFYRHLADHHVGGPESAMAREALIRLDSRRSQAGGEARPIRTSPPQVGQTSLARSSVPMPRVPNGASQQSGIRIAPMTSSEPAPPLTLPAPAGGYMVGRVIAYALAFVGACALAAGLAVMAAAIVLGTAGLSNLPIPAVMLHPLSAPVALLSGLVLLFWSQVARAVFDVARSAKDLAAIERAKVEHLAQHRGR